MISIRRYLRPFCYEILLCWKYLTLNCNWLWHYSGWKSYKICASQGNVCLAIRKSFSQYQLLRCNCMLDWTIWFYVLYWFFSFALQQMHYAEICYSVYNHSSSERCFKHLLCCSKHVRQMTVCLFALIYYRGDFW